MKLLKFVVLFLIGGAAAIPAGFGFGGLGGFTKLVTDPLAAGTKQLEKITGSVTAPALNILDSSGLGAITNQVTEPLNSSVKQLQKIGENVVIQTTGSLSQVQSGVGKILEKGQSDIEGTMQGLQKVGGNVVSQTAGSLNKVQAGVGKIVGKGQSDIEGTVNGLLKVTQQVTAPVGKIAETVFSPVKKAGQMANFILDPLGPIKKALAKVVEVTVEGAHRVAGTAAGIQDKIVHAVFKNENGGQSNALKTNEELNTNGELKTDGIYYGDVTNGVPFGLKTNEELQTNGVQYGELKTNESPFRQRNTNEFQYEKINTN